MANANVNFLGQINGAGDSEALFLKLFSGEVFGAFEQKSIMYDKHIIKTIKNGKSSQFPMVGKVGSGYHTPGSEILGSNVNQAEQVITLDGLLYSDVFVNKIDALKNHYDLTSEYKKQMGYELANRMDINVLRNVIIAARSANPVTGLPGGTEIVNADLGSVDVAIKQAALQKGLFDAATSLDEKNAPEERWAIFKPTEYNILAQTEALISSDYDGAGSISKGKIVEVAGIKILKSNNLPQDDSTGDVHAVDATTTVGVVFTKESVGTLKLLDIQTDIYEDKRRKGTLYTAEYVTGHGVLRPECAVELKTL